MMTKNIKKSNNTNKDIKTSTSAMQASKKPSPKVNSSNLSTTVKTKSTTKKSPTKKGSKVNLGITVFGLLLVLIVGTQIALNPKSKKATAAEVKTTNESTTTQPPSYPYFSNINNTFSSIFLSELNNYRENKGLSDLQRVRSISKGTTVTLQIPNIEQVAKNQNLNTETLLAEGVLHKFLESSNNVVIANATVPTVFLNTEMINGTLTLTVTVPYEHIATQPQNNTQVEPQVQPQQSQVQQQSPVEPQQQQQQQPNESQQEQQPSQPQEEPRIRHHENYNSSESSNENTPNNNSSSDTSSPSQNTTTGTTSTSQSRQ